MASLPTLSEGIALPHFIVAADVERAVRFYSDGLGGEIVLAGKPTIVALADSWIIIKVGGGPLARDALEADELTTYHERGLHDV